MSIDINLVPEELRDWVRRFNAHTLKDWEQVAPRWHPQQQLIAVHTRKMGEKRRIAKLKHDPKSLRQMVDKYMSDPAVDDDGPPLFGILACLDDSTLDLLIQTLDETILKIGRYVPKKLTN